MEANLEHMEERLWSYIDGASTGEEKSAVERLMQENASWREKYRELLEVSQLIHASELDQPSMRFTKNVMEEIAKLHIAPATKSYINNKIIWGIGVFFITILVGSLVYGIGQIDWTTSGNSNLPVDLSKVDYSKMFNNSYMNVLMMINVVLGLFLFDRYLTNKRKKFREEI
jgi:hypothetical protein